MRGFLRELGIEAVNRGATTGGSAGWVETRGETLVSYSPIDGKPIARITMAAPDDYAAVMTQAQEAFQRWRMLPGPPRGGRWCA